MTSAAQIATLAAMGFGAVAVSGLAVLLLIATAPAHDCPAPKAQDRLSFDAPKLYQAPRP